MIGDGQQMSRATGSPSGGMEGGRRYSNSPSDSNDKTINDNIR